MGKVTAGNSFRIKRRRRGLHPYDQGQSEELGIQPKMELKSFAYAGVKPEIMGIGPIPATHKALKAAGLTSTTSAW